MLHTELDTIWKRKLLHFVSFHNHNCIDEDYYDYGGLDDDYHNIIIYGDFNDNYGDVWMIMVIFTTIMAILILNLKAGESHRASSLVLGSYCGTWLLLLLLLP